MKKKTFKSLSLDSFAASKLSLKDMLPIIGGGCTTGNNSTNSTGSDSDTKTSDSDGDSNQLEI
jgi:natural product precursor